MTVKFPKWWPKLALAAALAFLWWRHDVGQRAEGALTEKIKARETVIAALAKQHRTDTLRLVTTRRVTDSILTVDTLLRVDTVRQIVQRERLACDALVGTCEAEKAQLRAQIVDLKKLKPSRFGCVAGGTASTKGAGLGVACGIRITK